MKYVLEGCLLVAMAAPAAMADFTPVNFSGLNGEPTLKQIVQNFYGGTFEFTGPGNVDLTNGTITLTRVHDFAQGQGLPQGVMHVNGSTVGSSDDNLWSDGTVQLHVRTAYSANKNTFGWYDKTTSPNSFKPLVGEGAGDSTTVQLSSAFEWGLQSKGLGTHTYRSNRFENAFAKDHMVTYRVTGPGIDRWLVAFEDLKLASFDYNDWVGEVEVVPLPSAAWAGLTMLGAFGAVRLLRRR